MYTDNNTGSSERLLIFHTQLLVGRPGKTKNIADINSQMIYILNVAQYTFYDISYILYR